MNMTPFYRRKRAPKGSASGSAARRKAPSPAALVLGMCLLAAGTMAGCIPATSYQPLGDRGGYEEVRLQPDMYRVYFQGNSETPMVRVIDFAFLRCAELTLAAGFTHFAIVQQSGLTNIAPGPGPYVGVGGSFGMRREGFFGGGFYGPPDYGYYVADRAAILIIKMLTADEAKTVPNAYDAAYIVNSLQSEKQKSIEQAKD